jgi:hypothetical protein
MRRRDRVPGEAPPEQLCRFVASEWPHGDYGPVVEWMNAALAWLAEDPRRRVPFGVGGDAVDMILESARLQIKNLSGGNDD